MLQALVLQAQSYVMKKNLIFSVSLFFILGLSWLFGFLIFGFKAASVVFAYIFTVLTSLQGRKILFSCQSVPSKIVYLVRELPDI